MYVYSCIYILKYVEMSDVNGIIPKMEYQIDSID